MFKKVLNRLLDIKNVLDNNFIRLNVTGHKILPEVALLDQEEGWFKRGVRKAIGEGWKHQVLTRRRV